MLPKELYKLDIFRANFDIIYNTEIESFGLIYVFAIESTLEDTLKLYKEIESNTIKRRTGIALMLSTITLSRFKKSLCPLRDSYYSIKKESENFATVHDWTKIYLGWHYERLGYPWSFVLLKRRVFLCERLALPSFLNKGALEELISHSTTLMDSHLYYTLYPPNSLFLPKGILVNIAIVFKVMGFTSIYNSIVIRTSE